MTFRELTSGIAGIVLAGGLVGAAVDAYGTTPSYEQGSEMVQVGPVRDDVLDPNIPGVASHRLAPGVGGVYGSSSGLEGNIIAAYSPRRGVDKWRVCSVDLANGKAVTLPFDSLKVDPNSLFLSEDNKLVFHAYSQEDPLNVGTYVFDLASRNLDLVLDGRDDCPQGWVDNGTIFFRNRKDGGLFSFDIASGERSYIDRGNSRSELGNSGCFAYGRTPDGGVRVANVSARATDGVCRIPSDDSLLFCFNTGSPGIFHGNPVWGPDGRRLAFEGKDRSDGGEDSEIFVYDSLTNSVTQLTDDGCCSSNPSWTSDGRNVIFSRIDYHYPPMEGLCVVDLQGHVRRITDNDDVRIGKPVDSNVGHLPVGEDFEYILNNFGKNFEF